MSHNTTRSTAAQNENANAASKQQVNNPRHTETREHWDVIFTHAVTLVVAHIRGQKVTKSDRDGFKFGTHAQQPHAKAYAQSLLTGFTTSKAGKVLKENDDLSDRDARVKIAMAILLGTNLAKDGNEGAQRIMDKSEPKREKAFAQAVLEALNKPIEQPATEEPTTPSKGGGKKGKKGSKK